ncbi:hypothetical protein EUA94_17755 [Nocardioides zhouii]|uniref:GIY-YIG catalytic domain-containing protein n=2 Tax=Nocardioides zhouii TaxID=1168729 RepID=A0A4Q2SJJ7_9ACTN|nr:hypothetical protein EUA94_17755 [Nocardioides zhouii]
MDVEPTHEAAALLLRPHRLFTRDEVLGHPCPVAATPGVYAWYFDEVPAVVPTDGCVRHDGHTLLYVGISPGKPPANGRGPSRQTVRSRLRYHYRGNAYGSTLRLTLGSLLADDLGIELRLVGSGTRLTFASGEAELSRWMGRHAHVCWLETPEPWLLEHDMLQHNVLPLNLDQNGHSPFRQTLSAIRGAQRARARSLPVI